MNPNYQDVEATAVYRRGRELADSETDREEPQGETAGQVLAGAGVTLQEYCRWHLARYREAWERQLTTLPFPIRVEGERVFCRNWKGEWEEETGFTADLILGNLSLD